jgi:hypothetical protein
MLQGKTNVADAATDRIKPLMEIFSKTFGGYATVAGAIAKGMDKMI